MKATESENPAPYGVRPESTPRTESEVIELALKILAKRYAPGQAITSPSDLKVYLRILLAGHEHEVFGIVYLDSQHCIIEVEDLFRGTLTSTSVYPREVVKAVLKLNAAAVVLYHNHPSGNPEPSRADEYLTTTLKSALALVDVKVLDHVVVGSQGAVSFAERGLL